MRGISIYASKVLLAAALTFAPVACSSGAKSDGVPDGGGAPTGTAGVTGNGTVARTSCGPVGTRPGGALRAGDFPMQGFDARRTGRVPYDGPTTAAVKWTYVFPTRGQDNASPVVGRDGTIYQPTETGVFALRPDGTLLWKNETPFLRIIRNAPVLSSDGTRLFVGSDNHIVALGTQDGTMSWIHDFVGDNSYSSLLTGPDGTIYFGSRVPAAMNAVSPNGSPKWRTIHCPPGDEPARFGIEGPAAMGLDGQLFVPSNCGGLTAFAGNGGGARWNHEEGTIGLGYWQVPAVGDDGVVYYPGHDDGAGSGAAAFTPDGNKKWATPDSQGGPGMLSGVALSWDGGTLYRAFAGQIEALNTETGATRWRRAIAGKDVHFGGSPLLSANGILYWMGGDDLIYAACADDGTFLWKHHLESSTEVWGPQSPALAADGTLYVFSSGTPLSSGNLPGRLYAFGGAPVTTTGGAGAGGGADGGADRTAAGGASTGSCMKLLACCDAATGANKADCMTVYEEKVAEGGPACAAAYQALGEDFCPTP